ncbi:DUF3866 family protein [Phytohabitans sp. ZYX-F-186]|uniref:DUF3866 family protein n=1 Tax=Phytohabitans maris TaxID=3071409 RepID=A0ABU0ZNM5_9ACTN|nr:DUF3866 family protein [Phytohabitans sp. ZYX-F-186]MDQ7908637.1 DUF3866 family protein [Phytohabitans sp. ZYX-F-186]
MGAVRWRSGVVTSVGRRWRGVVTLDVEVASAVVRALAYPALTGEPRAGDRVLLNVGALEMGLGTGGYALVVALPDRLPADPPGSLSRESGHLVKARYTPLQAIVLGVDEEASPHRALMASVDSVDGMPVVVADLHSALPAILAGLALDRPGTTVAYVMTDGGALPAWFSRTLDGLRDHLAGTVTVGQSFGGDLEATTVHSGLLAARHVLRADVTVVAQGPGNLGTGTAWGFSGVAAGEVVNAVAALGGRPVAALRLSDADPRPRHRGVSHHSLTAYGRVALAPADVVVPSPLPPPLAAAVSASLAPLAARHRVVEVPVDGLEAALKAAPVPLSTMGRGLDADPWYFLAAAAAGRHAAALLPRSA